MRLSDAIKTIAMPKFPKQTPSERKLKWRKCKNGPCSLNRLKLQSIPKAQGVYIIWADGPEPIVVYAGKVKSTKRTFADRFGEHRNEDSIQQWQEEGESELRVTLAVVLERDDIDGIERFLIDELSPIENEVTPSAAPIPVTLPSFLPT